LTPLQRIKENVPKRIYIDCKNLLTGWVNNGGDQLFLEDCNTGQGGKAIYNGQSKKWKYFQKGDKLYLNFTGSNNPVEFVVNNPTQKNNIYLELVRKGNTNFTPGNGVVYSKRTKKQIFCENIAKEWVLNKAFSKDKIFINPCENTMNLGSSISYNGTPGRMLASHVKATGMTITIKTNEETLIFKVHNPLNKNKIQLELLDGKKGTGKFFK